jgi:peptidoglycan/xylan/chitin deacetylase (PgdA/CDA1 family)
MPFWALKKLFANYPIIPVYHVVSDQDLCHIKHLYKYKSVSGFERELDLFLRHYKPVGIDEIISKTVKNAFHLTFDDGFSECYNVIMPILYRKGIPASFFVNTDFIDNKNMQNDCIISLICDSINNLRDFDSRKSYIMEKCCHYDSIKSWLFEISCADENSLIGLCHLLDLDIKGYLELERPYMSSSEILDLSMKGFNIGSHGKSHINYKYLNLEEQLFDTLTTTSYIQTNFSQSLSLFAFPYEDIQVTNEYFTSLGNKVDATFGTSGLFDDLPDMSYQRVWMESPDNCEFIHYFNGLYNSKAIRRFINKCDVLIRN